jgi:hypothetical protein
MMEGPGADSEEKHEPAGDIDTEAVDSLKALDPNRPIREADISWRQLHVRFVPIADIGAEGRGSAYSPQENLSLTFSLFSLPRSFEYRY